MIAVSPLERRLARLLLAGRTFTADDVTADGAVALDPDHHANGKQNAIGSMFNQASRRGLIDFTGEVVRSNALHRKGGCIRNDPPLCRDCFLARQRRYTEGARP